MDFLYLSPEFPPNYANFIIQLAKHGVSVWAMGETDFYNMKPRLQQAISYYQKTDFGSHTAVDEALAELLQVKATMGAGDGFDVVESHNEMWLDVEARINEQLDIPGIRPNDLQRLKKKAVMKGIFSGLGLATARGELLTDTGRGLALGEEIGFPLILKPNEGVGAAAIHKVVDKLQLRELLPGLREEYVMEEFIDAPIVSYDGLTDWDGNILCESSLTYGAGVLEFIQGKDTFFYTERHPPIALCAIGRRLIEAFAIRRKFFHFEFFVRDGDYIPIEVNCRPPGGAILDMMNYTIDDNLYAAYARMITSQKEPAVKDYKKYYCAFVGRRDRDYLYSHGQLVKNLGHDLIEYGENPPVFRDGMSHYRYIIRSQDKDKLMSMAVDIQRQR
jgi:hypothetical protein